MRIKPGISSITLVFLVLFFCCLNSSTAQQTKINLIITAPPHQNKPKIKVPLKTNHDSTTANIGQMALEQLYSKGFIAATVDTIISDSQKTTISISSDQKYFIHAIDQSGVPNDCLIKTNKYIKKPFSYTVFQNILNSFVLTCKNRGYPLAKVQLTPVFNQNHVTLTPKLEKGRYFVFDTLLWQPENILNQGVAQQLTKINPGHGYNETLVQNIRYHMQNQGFLVLDSMNVDFTQLGKVKIKLMATEKKMNRFSGFVGLLKGSNNKAEVNGGVNLTLTNTLKWAETLNFSWKKTDRYSQQLNLQTNVPYLLGQPIGFSGGIFIEKQDSAYNQVNYNLGAIIGLKKLASIKAYYEVKLINNTKISTSYNDTKSNQYGISTEYKKTDELINPSKGAKLVLDGKFGNRRIEKKLTTDKHLLIDLQASATGYIPMKNNTLVLSSTAQLMHSDSLQHNELYRIGGLNSLRGFPEKGIYTDKYMAGSIEYRFRFNQKSNVFIFTDAALFSHHKPAREKEVAQRFATGGGLNLQTKAGRLSLVYAIGIAPGVAISPTNGHVHIGYINYF